MITRRNLRFYIPLSIGVGTLLIAGLIGCSSPPRYPESDHYHQGKFSNPVPTKKMGFFGVVGHILFGRNGKWQNHLSVEETYKDPSPLKTGQLAVTFVGHATTLIQTKSTAILTDPVWSNRVGPFSWAGPMRSKPPGVPFENLPKIDLVVISHNHYDHLDLPTLKQLWERDHPHFVVPLGVADLLLREGIQSTQELDWWQSIRFSDELEIVLTRTQHNSGRGIFGRDESLWGGYFIRTDGRSVYFAGDTAYSDHFEETYRRLGQVDVALIPIGAYEPRETMSANHLNPAEAVKAFTELRAKLGIGIHYGMFQLTAEDFDAPPRDLAVALKNAGLSSDAFLAVKEGKTTFFPPK